MVVPDDTSTERVRIYASGDVVSPRVEAVEPLSLELADFCRCIEGWRPRASADLGVAVVEVAAHGRGTVTREPTAWNA
jgi:hypothetical protein